MKFLYMLCYTLLLVFLMLIKFVCSSNNIKSNVSVGYTFTLAIPSDYSHDFTGKAYLMETDQMPLNFRAAMSIEPIEGRYACSIEVYLGNVKVWSSGHGSNNKFFAAESCVLELTRMGELRLRDGQSDVIGWKTGTAGQGVEKLQLLDTGNLVLVDAQEHIKWQTFNFPTNILLLGQRLSVATHLTSFPAYNNDSTSFFSFEIHHDKVALYLNSGGSNNNNNTKYSYWEFHPSSESKNITFIELASRGLEFFDDKFVNYSQIIPPYQEPVRFLALDNDTGNLGLYYYSPYKDKFEASYRALNTTCDLPLACSPYGICTFSKTCSCIRLVAGDDSRETPSNGGCDEGISTGTTSCRNNDHHEVVTMLELEDAGSVLKNRATSMANVSSKSKCANSCLSDCVCAAALYSSRTSECAFFDVVRGVKQVGRGSGLSYMVKVPKGKFEHNKKSGLRKWVLMLILVVDGMVLFMVVGGLVYFIIWKRKRRLRDENCSSS